VQGGQLIDPKTKRPFEIEFLLVSPEFERVVAPFIQNLRRLGIAGRIRTVDPAQYQNRVREFDFDMVVATFPQSLSPGNEQRDFWSSAAATRPGSRNLVGIRNEAVDALVEKIVEAHDRTELVAASRALDRVLSWNHYVIPQWHINSFRLAYWNRFGIPPARPDYGVGFFAWWIDPAKDRALGRAP
jgi:microcin C transport system substrate-binding protein